MGKEILFVFRAWGGSSLQGVGVWHIFQQTRAPEDQLVLPFYILKFFPEYISGTIWNTLNN